MGESGMVGAILREIRRKCGHTLADTAKATGWTMAAASRAERGVMPPETLGAYMPDFCRAYGVKVTAAGYSFTRPIPEPMRVPTVPIEFHHDGSVTIAQPEHTAADMAAALSSLFPDGPAVLSFGDDEGDE